MSDNTIKVEVNGIELEARPGEMLIAVTDRAGIYVPRFCYHETLSVAASSPVTETVPKANEWERPAP